MNWQYLLCDAILAILFMLAVVFIYVALDVLLEF